jgi:uncharacterized membrane-anchored protein
MTDEMTDIYYAVVRYEEEDYYFMPIVSDVFAEAVSEHLSDYDENISTYVSDEAPALILEDEHPELYNNLRIETVRLVCAIADASIELVKEALERKPPAKRDRSHLRVVK